MTASAALLAAAGLALLFIPGELQRLVTGSGQSSGPPVVLQLWGASLLGLAAMSWIGRGRGLGGIYGRALVMANLVHWTVGGFTAVREVLDRPASGAPGRRRHSSVDSLLRSPGCSGGIRGRPPLRWPECPLAMAR